MTNSKSKFNPFGSDGIKFIPRPPKQRLYPRYQLATVKPGGDLLMVKFKEAYIKLVQIF